MYSTDEKVKDFITLPADMGTTEVNQYIAVVSRFMDKTVGYKIGYVSGDALRTLLFNGSGTDTIDLGANWLADFSDVIVSQDDIVITDEVLAFPMNETYKNMLVMKSGNFCETRAGIKVEGAKVGAYVVDWKDKAKHNLPAELEHACNVLVGSIIRLKKAGGVQTAGKVASEKTSQYAITFSDGIAGEQGPDEISALSTLALYKDHFIA